MSPFELEKYLHDHIPLSKAMQVAVVSRTTDEVILSAPLPPNINHRDTLFGGSASAVAILSAWSLLHTRMLEAGVSSRLVIQRNTMDYHLPVLGTFTARGFLTEPAVWQKFLAMLKRKGKARISVSAVLESNGQLAGSLSGEFVALGSSVI